MDIKNKTVLVLGGYGLVGSAVVKHIVKEQPKEVIITSLFKHEVDEALKTYREHFPELPKGYFKGWWGNIFVREEFKDSDRSELLKDPVSRAKLIHDIMDDLDEDILENSALYKIITTYNPDIIIDCINTATAIAYQDVYSTYREIKNVLGVKKDYDELAQLTEKLLCTMYTPQLIRHIQILYSAMNAVNTGLYFKIGTSGTGGMGLNIPYTHSEEKPSRVLLSKSAIGGAHTLLLFLMGRTPGAITKEIKPTAAIAWKRIEFGEIKKRGKPIQLLDVNFDNAIKLENKLQLIPDEKFPAKDETLKNVFIDTGENGLFSRGEFEAITLQGQMEFVTPEEIADIIVNEIKGRNTGHDVINALDIATLNPTYRAGFMQHMAVKKLKELEKINDIDSVAFEMLGPPRLSKLLFEIYLLKKVFSNMENIINNSPEVLSKKITEFLKNNEKIVSQAVSVGIPILLPDGESLIRGNEIKIPPFRGQNELDITPENINSWAYQGWIDLRVENMRVWIERIKTIIAQAESIPTNDTSSTFVFTKDFWNNFQTIDIGKVVGWLFITEEKGERIKA
ncbi:MAG TPA: short-chain dehydrogenase [Ignavibacteriales bacterium]|nr:short-chain dehydrogenase [Ignavibacteriales bacterium]HOM65225.1 short-chain dehydrogenase [Ignavibacteriales bacterium]HPD66517.1 short-chain dehydrogenase [Ignavibacteriales bacterium]HPP33522.1 short-chain dehydrogenase [Ignavibacteriales bacterium]HRR18436.1 short-chain dehydrogenase [Ignavibacteriales bacterium]